MHVSGFLIFLAIVVYWASCMGPRALKGVAILFVSVCLLPVAAVFLWWASYAVPRALDDYRLAHPSEATVAAQTIADFTRAEDAKGASARAWHVQRAGTAIAAARAQLGQDERVPATRRCLSTYAMLIRRYQEEPHALLVDLFTEADITQLAAACREVPVTPLGHTRLHRG